jgi:hypothetical protein
MVKCDDDLYVVTTGHRMINGCEVDSADYTLVNHIWPSALVSSDATSIRPKCYHTVLSEDDDNTCSFISDVAILRVNERTNYKCDIDPVPSISYHKIINEKNYPILPLRMEPHDVVYKGLITSGNMKIVGSGYFKNHIGISLSIHERFYVAKHISSQLNEDYEDYLVDASKVDGSKGTVSGDSGACVTTMDGKIHSFVIGTSTGENQFRLLSPAHFVLEQIKSLTMKKNVDFVRCVEKKSAFYGIAVPYLQSIYGSVVAYTRGIFSRLYNRSILDDTSDGNDIGVAAQTSTASDSHPMLHTPSHVACTVDRQDGNNGTAATDVSNTCDNDESEVDGEYSQPIKDFVKFEDNAVKTS